MGYILVVDDLAENRDLLSRRLEKKGFTTLVAENGMVALELVEKKEIDLVLLDIRMPGLDGNQVLEKIREKYPPTHLPVIMVTAENDSSSEIKSLGLGADDYITKPIDFKVLLARLKNKLTISNSIKEKESNQNTEDPERFSEENIRILIDQGESHNVELKSTLRWNIHSKKLGKEIEQAWLKTVVAFLNSDGGTLLVGVSDDGSINGLESDRFQNDDKLLLFVNNTITDRIGVEYIDYISYHLLAIEDKKILLVECQSVNDAVFLKGDKEDEFYVRFGPASKKLTTKEVLAYLKNKKN